MATLPVKYFHSSMQGAPQLTNAWGAMTALLDAVLVDGFNLKSITSMTSAAGIATVNIAAGHLYEVDQVLLISGANEAAYNGEVRVLTTTANTLTFAVAGSPASPATGTLTVKVAPLGFECPFTGTNKRAYRSLNPQSNKSCLRVDDGLDPVYTTTYAKYAKVTMAEGMSDIDTFVGARAPYSFDSPTRNEIGTGSGVTAVNGWFKWYYARAEGYASESSAPAAYNRQWTVIGDDRGFYLFNEVYAGGGLSGKCFGDFASYRSADGFNTILCAHDAYMAANTAFYNLDGEGYYSADWRVRFVRTQDTTGKLALRGHLQVGNPVPVSFTSLNTNNGQVVSGYSTGISWPNGPDYSLVLHPALLKEGAGLRGKMPGMFWVHNDSPNFNHLDRIANVSGYDGRKFLMVRAQHGVSSYSFTAWLAFDMTGPWW